MMRTRGFTLVEMLVALAILAVLGAATYRGLGAILDTRAAAAAHAERWRGIALFYTLLEHDLAAAAPRPARDASGLARAALAGDPAPQPAAPLLALTRYAPADLPGEQAPPLRVGYRVRDAVLEALAYDALDAAPQEAASVQPLLAGVAALELRYLDALGTWWTAWPRGEAPLERLPVAVEARLVLASGERIVRLLPVVAGAAP
jgi:general secretion pathway protein J